MKFDLSMQEDEYLNEADREELRKFKGEKFNKYVSKSGQVP